MIRKYILQKGIAQIPVILGLLIIGIALPAALKLTQDIQETRRSAAEGTFFDFGTPGRIDYRAGTTFAVGFYLTPLAGQPVSSFDVSIPFNCEYIEVLSIDINSAVEEEFDILSPFNTPVCRNVGGGKQFSRGVFRVKNDNIIGTRIKIAEINFRVKENVDASGKRIVNNWGWVATATGPADTKYNLTGKMPSLDLPEKPPVSITPTLATDTSCAVVSATCLSTTSDSITYQITYDDGKKEHWDGLVVGNSPTDIIYQEEQWPETYTLRGLDGNSSYSYKFGCHKFYDGVGTSLSWQTRVGDVIPANGCPGAAVLPTLTPMPTVPVVGGLPACTISGPNAIYLPGQRSITYRANFDYDGDLSSLGLDYQWDLYGNGCGSFIDGSDLWVTWLAPEENASCRLAVSATRTVSGQEQQIVCTKDVSVFAAPLTPNPTATTSPSSCPRGSEGDLNCDSRINVIDLSILLEAWVYSIENDDVVPTPKAGRPSANLDGRDGVDVSDAQVVLSNWDVIGD